MWVLSSADRELDRTDHSFKFLPNLPVPEINCNFKKPIFAIKKINQI